jgi:hypothetical protein
LKKENTTSHDTGKGERKKARRAREGGRKQGRRGGKAGMSEGGKERERLEGSERDAGREG